MNWTALDGRHYRERSLEIIIGDVKTKTPRNPRRKAGHGMKRRERGNGWPDGAVSRVTAQYAAMRLSQQFPRIRDGFTKRERIAVSGFEPLWQGVQEYGLEAA